MCRLSSSPRLTSAPARPRRFPIVLGLVFLLAAGCGKRERAVETGGKTATLHVGNGAEPQELDPHLTTGSPESAIQRTLLEGLLVVDPRTGDPIPGAAKSWETSPDGRTVTFTLRPDGRWSDGAPVTADDFVQSFRRLFTPALGADFATEFYCIAGAREFHQGKSSDFSTVGVAAPDAATVRFTLVDPVPQFLHLLATPAAMPVRIPLLKRLGALERRGTTWTRPEHFIGNGRFVLQAWQPHQHIIVTRSPTYRGADPSQLESIRFYPVDQADAEERMFRAGQLHLTFTVPAAKVTAYQREEPARLRLAPEARNYYYVFNVDRAPFQDVRVRRALALAIDRTRIATQVLKAGQTPARQFVPPDPNGFSAPAQFTDDLAAAQSLLAAAGFPGGQGLPTITLLINNSERSRLLAETVQQMWRQYFGIRLEVEAQEWKVYLDSLKNGAYQLSFDGWSFPVPLQFYSLLTTGNSASYNRWSNADYDALVRAAHATSSEDTRRELYLQLEQLLAREMPVIPVYFNASAHLVRPEVQGWHANRLDAHPLAGIAFGR